MLEACVDSTQLNRKELELTPQAFAKLLARLAPSSEAAGERYEQLRRQLIKFFEWRGSHFPDQLADETLNRLARKLDQGEEIEKDVTAFTFGIARFVFLEALKSPDTRRAALDDFTGLPGPTGFQDDDDLWVICLRECLRGVSDENRDLIIEYYQDERRVKIDNRRELAAGLGISLNALFSRAKRTRDKLERCVTSCVGRKPPAAT
jgi:DNA-directed RNA polymerase specialized sigma24 family protein